MLKCKSKMVCLTVDNNYFLQEMEKKRHEFSLQINNTIFSTVSRTLQLANPAGSVLVLYGYVISNSDSDSHLLHHLCIVDEE